MVGVLGIDTEKFYEPALRLAGRLAFEGTDWHFAHVVPPLGMVAAPFESGEDVETALEADRAASEELMDNVLDEACAYGINPRNHRISGPVTSSIMDLSDTVEADLVAVGSHRSGRLAAAFLGSVGRALAIGSKRSLLIGRGEVKQVGPVGAIFATDHSYYAMRALDRLIDMKPLGLKKITLLTAYDEKQMHHNPYYGELVREAKETGTTPVHKLKELSEATVAKLREAGFLADYQMKPGNVHDAIDRAMLELKPDLLILGAQGHGFLERVLMGSVALHQVVAEPHSVLIVRP